MTAPKFWMLAARQHSSHQHYISVLIVVSAISNKRSTPLLAQGHGDLA
jgi:hypothetical protein